MNTTTVYRPGHSWLHRLPAGAKLLGMLAAGVAILFLRAPWQGGVAVAVALGLYLSAGLGLRLAVAQLRPLVWMLALLTAGQWLVSGWERAAAFAATLCCLVLVASLVTLTTRTTDLVDALTRALSPLRVLGLRPERLALMIALATRAVAVVVGLAQDVRDAQRARGLTASPRAFAVPLVVRSLRYADNLGDALVARGLDDD